MPALYARGHGVCRRRDRAAHDHDDGGGRELSRADAGGVSSVSVSGEVKPLPVIGAFAQAMGGTAEGGYVELKVDVSYQSRPEWLEGDYDSWIAAWD